MNKLPIFYPIVPNLEWVKKIVPLGVKIIQLRMKNSSHQDIRVSIQESLKITRAYDCRLVVNDYWETALETGAEYVHLGQEDLAFSDQSLLRRAGIKVGISTHSKEELEIALKVNPFYVALGPIFETKLKIMKWPPQGLNRIREWRERIGSLPLVAIGGLTPEKAHDIVLAGADSLAVITDFMTAKDPLQRVKNWLKTTNLKQGRI
ncbi:MAG: thiamine phosphate synthase [Hyphomicrobium sp.]